VSVGSILEGAFRILRARPGAVLIWMIIYLALSVAMSFATVAMIKGQVDARAAGASEASASWSLISQGMALSVVALLVTMIVCAAVLRAVLRPGEGGPGALRLGMDEVRLFLLALLYMVGTFIALFVIGIFAAILAGTAGTGAALLVMGGVTLALGAFFYTKLSLSFPLTLMRKRFVVGEAWNLTRDRFWTLFTAYLVLFLLLLALSLLAALVTEREYFAAIFQGGFDSERAQQADVHEYEALSQGVIDSTIFLRWASDAVLGALSAALFGAANATAVKELTFQEEGLRDTFA